MSRRLEFHEILCDLLGSRNVYFQPPSNVKMKYPCIVYHRSQMSMIYANNQPYNIQDAYRITVIDKDPDSDIPKKIANLSLCKMDRHFTVDNLNHDIFIIYY